MVVVGVVVVVVVGIGCGCCRKTCSACSASTSRCLAPSIMAQVTVVFDCGGGMEVVVVGGFMSVSSPKPWEVLVDSTVLGGDANGV